MAAGSYLDTSVLFKLFLHEPDSDRVVLWASAQAEPLWVSDLSDLEVATTFTREELQPAGRRALEAYWQECLRGNFRETRSGFGCVFNGSFCCRAAHSGVQVALARCSASCHGLAVRH